MFEKISNDNQVTLTSIISLLGLVLVLFVGVKIVGEIISWNENEMYPSNTINVIGEGEVLAVPDIATFSFTVSQNEDTVENAQNEATRIINEAIAFLKENGVEDKDIKTSAYNVYPQYDYNPVCNGINCPIQSPRIIGYEVSQTTQIKVRQADEAGRFLTELGKLGVSNVSGLSFVTDDEDVYRDQAREKAIENAKEKAQKLADQLGVELEDIISFSEDQPYEYYPEARFDAYGGATEQAMVKSPTLSVGENSYKSRVWINYEID